MKFVPDTILRKVASTRLTASENSPKILFVGGVVGMVGSTVLACRATLKLEEVLDKVENDKERAVQVKELVDNGGAKPGTTYTDNEYRRDVAVITMRGIGGVVKLYAPAVVVGGLSIAALTKSHNMLRDRNIALTAAYTAVDTAYRRYRERVIEKYGEEVDQEIRYESERVDIVDEETGLVESHDRVVDAPGSVYARFYDEVTSPNWSPDPEINLLFLRSQQNWLNDRLKARGHVFLNEVFTELGLSHTKAGAIVGWRWRKGSGDDVIDFGIWDGTRETVNEFFNGREGAILLDFNVDGVIYDLIEGDQQ